MVQNFNHRRGEIVVLKHLSCPVLDDCDYPNIKVFLSPSLFLKKKIIIKYFYIY